MSKLRYIALLSIVFATSLALVACGSQPTNSVNEAKSPQTATKKAKTEAEAAKEKAKAEPPAVEIIPHKELAEPEITMEPLPAEKPVTPAETEQESTAPAATAANAAEKEVTQPPVIMEPVKQPKPETPSEAVTEAAKAKTPAKEAPVSAKLPADKNTFIITVGPKVPPHPFIGKGHNMGFIVNGVSGKQLVLVRGQTYTFDVETNAKHDVYLSTKPIGWGASPLVEGVTGAFTYKGKITFKPTASTPDKVYYACRNHPYMGSLIQIINPGEKAKPALISPTISEEGVSTGTLEPKVSEAKVKQKLLFAEMMLNSEGAKRVTGSQNEEAKQLLAKAKSFMSQGHQKLQAGALPEALTLADESLKVIGQATKLVPSQDELAQLAEKYKSMLAEINDYRKSHKNNLERMEKAGTVADDVRYDEKKVDELLTKAQGYANKSDYINANKILKDVRQTVTVALHNMLDSQTIVYDLNFATAADEYDYELKRFSGYEELIPIAIEAKKPSPGAIKLMQSFVDKARKRRDQAVSKAEAGEYGDAIAMLQQATKTVRRALRMVGVMQ
jgi:hypothetical protein